MRFGRTTALLLALAVLLGALAGCGMGGGQPAVDPLLAVQEGERQREVGLIEMQRKARRIKNVEWALVTANAELCGGEAVSELGFGVWSLENFPDKDRLPAKRAFGLDERLRVSTIAQGSPARRAGLVEGDILLVMDGQPVNPGAAGADEFLRRLGGLLRQGREISFTVSRGGEAYDLSMTPRKACPYRVLLAADDAVNALADGRNVVITDGMLRYTENDDQLGMVLAREMARNAMGHQAKRQKAALAEAVTGYVLSYMTGFDFTGISQQYVGDLTRKAGEQFYGPQAEQEADYVGLYYAARAGFDVEKAPYFWRKLAVTHPQLMGGEGKHAAGVERLLKIDEAVAEIAAKQAGGLAVAPTPRPTTGK